MLIDRYEPADVFARMPGLADQTDPVLVQLDRLLGDDQFYVRLRADLAHRALDVSGVVAHRERSQRLDCRLNRTALVAAWQTLKLSTSTISAHHTCEAYP